MSVIVAGPAPSSLPAGGSTGEALKKSSGADGDVEWAADVDTDRPYHISPDTPASDGDAATFNGNAIYPGPGFATSVVYDEVAWQFGPPFSYYFGTDDNYKSWLLGAAGFGSYVDHPTMAARIGDAHESFQTISGMQFYGGGITGNYIGGGLASGMIARPTPSAYGYPFPTIGGDRADWTGDAAIKASVGSTANGFLLASLPYVETEQETQPHDLSVIAGPGGSANGYVVNMNGAVIAGEGSIAFGHIAPALHPYPGALSDTSEIVSRKGSFAGGAITPFVDSVDGYSAKMLGGSTQTGQLAAFAFGEIKVPIGGNDAGIYATGAGSVAFGLAGNPYGGTIWAQGKGALAGGMTEFANSYYKADIIASGDGSFAWGAVYALSAATKIEAGGVGCAAFGYAYDADIVADGYNCFQFGPGTNELDESVQVGTELRFKGTDGAPGSPTDGDMWMDSGVLKIRTDGVTFSFDSTGLTYA